jgi:polyferredoxin
MTRTIRIVFQILFFALFTFFIFFVNRNGPAQQVRAQWFLQLNPLVALLTSVASRTVITAMAPGALVLILLTIFLGRFFCGFVCPLGAAIDFTDHAIIGKARHSSRRPPAYMRRFKYVLLLALTVLAVFGVVVPLFMDPISLTTRIMALIIDPLLRIVEASGKNGVALLAAALHRQALSLHPFAIALPGSILLSALFFALFVGGFWDRRFWCQYLCPSGALFGLLSRVALLRRRVVAGKCNACRSCVTRLCPTRAIGPDNPTVTSTAECILCGVCSNNKRACSRIGFAMPGSGEMGGPDLKRRHAVAGIVAGLAALPIVRSTAFDTASDIELIRPPGALPEELFLTRCIACGECMKACPNHALGPCGFVGSLMRLSTPRLLPRMAFCEPECTACSHVCPTTALRPIALTDKPFIKIGTAIVDQSRCIAWRGERRCLTCMTQCPYQAIDEKNALPGDGGPSGPVVDKDLCTGCGKCEFVCPMETVAAIRVQSHGERRVATGPFISDARRDRIAHLRNNKVREK